MLKKVIAITFFMAIIVGAWARGRVFIAVVNKAAVAIKQDAFVVRYGSGIRFLVLLLR